MRRAPRTPADTAAPAAAARADEFRCAFPTGQQGAHTPVQVIGQQGDAKGDDDHRTPERGGTTVTPNGAGPGRSPVRSPLPTRTSESMNTP